MTDALSPILDRHLSQWPVDHVAAAVIGPGATSATEAANPTEAPTTVIACAGNGAQVFELASVTKLLAAYGFMVALEEGVFDLDTVISHNGATVRHLLSHAGGVGFKSTDSIKPIEQRRIYSSYGFELLADAVAAESDMSFAEYLTEAVFVPLGMTATELWGLPGHEARSTVDDLSAFVLEVLTPTLIDPSTVHSMFQLQYPDLNGIVPGYGMQKPCPWGLGFEIRGRKQPHWTGTTMPEDTVGHFGQSGTFVWLHPGTQRAMIVLTNREFGEWAKPVWPALNDDIWANVSLTTTA
ncbi:MAG: serine hydrolase domain-containing protein [Corynebacterium sp.]|nr:serine hydrolase domain-containing protein [Corynebacterium sp.]